MARDPYRYFRIEGRELLDQLVKCTLGLDQLQAPAKQIAQLLRLAHTLKGAARVVKQLEISNLAHAVEESLSAYRNGERAVERKHIDGLLATLDGIAGHLARLPGPDKDPNAVVAPDALGAVRTELSDVDSVLEGLGEIQGELVTLHQAAERMDHARQMVIALTSQLGSLRATVSGVSRGNASIARVQASATGALAAMTSAGLAVASAVGRAEREVHQTREQAERMRLTPASILFNSLERVVRDSAQAVGRRVVFEAKGGDVRLDGHVMEVVQGALVQIVRNAVAHGIESAADRERTGKPPDGHVSLEVLRRGQRILFRCTDDGRGVDLQGVRQALKRAGRLQENAEKMEASRLIDLLLKGGISTAASVTELSGRGIGLDVVREIADKLGGDVSLQTTPGAGTTVEMRVPISLASLDALIVEAAGQIAAIPLEAIRATMRIQVKDVMHAPAGDSIICEGKVTPLRALAGFLSDNAPRARAERRAFSALLLEGDSRNVVIGVDRLTGKETITVRPLPTFAPADDIVAGIYLDAEGNPRPVLEPQALLASPQRAFFRSQDAQKDRATHRVLVIDDSITTRMLEQSILESAGYQVDLATCAEEGLETARRNSFQLFLVDLEMPGMDGFGFIETSRADPVLRRTPCILVTSRDSPEDRRRAQEAGASAYIVKSEFDQIAFLQRIAALIQT